jgi:hypothetical protein
MLHYSGQRSSQSTDVTLLQLIDQPLLRHLLHTTAHYSEHLTVLDYTQHNISATYRNQCPAQRSPVRADLDL